jgi:hypothetical protein
MSLGRPGSLRRSVAGEIFGRWAVALVLVPVVLPVVLLGGGHVTVGMLIWGIAIMTVVALVRGRPGRL